MARPPSIAPPFEEAPTILPGADPIFHSTTLGVWRFNQSLEDSVVSHDFSPSVGSALFKKFEKFELNTNRIETRYGLEFEDEKSYRALSLGNHLMWRRLR